MPDTDFEVVRKPVTDLFHTRFPGTNSAAFLAAYEACEMVFNTEATPNEFEDETAAFRAAYENVDGELSPLPPNLGVTDYELSTWPLTPRISTAKPPRQPLSVGNLIRSIPLNGISKAIKKAVGRKHDGVWRYGRAPDFDRLTPGQNEIVFASPDEARGFESEVLASHEDEITSIAVDTWEVDLSIIFPKRIPTLRQGFSRNAGRVTKWAGEKLRTKTGQVAFLGALALATTLFNKPSNDASSAVRPHSSVTVVNASQTERTPNIHAQATNPLSASVNILFNGNASGDNLAMAGLKTADHGGEHTDGNKEPQTVAPHSAEPLVEAEAPHIVLERGETVWGKVSDELQAKGITKTNDLINATADVVAELRTDNPTLNLDVVPSGELPISITPNLLAHVLLVYSAA